MARGGGDSYRPFLPATGPPNFGPTHLGTPGRNPRRGTFVMVISRRYPSAASPPRATEVTSRTTPTLPYPPPILYSRCAERPGVRSLCLEEFLETLLSSDQGRRDFSPDPRLRRRNGNFDKEGEEQRGRVGSRLYT